MKRWAIFTVGFLLGAKLAWSQSPVSPESAGGRPTTEDARWMPVNPRTPAGIYPHVPGDYEAMPNPLYDVPAGRLAGLRICIDAGHGGQVYGPTRGYTAGTRGTNSGLTESEANFRAALFLWDLLTQAGAEVTMTRTREVRVTPSNTSDRDELHARDVIADEAGCDYFIAIHHNAPGSGQPRDTNYTAVYYYDTTKYDAEYNAEAPYGPRQDNPELNEARYTMAQCIQAELAEHLEIPAISLSANNQANLGHGVPHGDFHVIRETNLPAVLVECSFMTNAEEDIRLNDPARARQEALAIFEGLLTYFEQQPMRRWSEPGAPAISGGASQEVSQGG